MYQAVGNISCIEHTVLSRQSTDTNSESPHIILTQLIHSLSTVSISQLRQAGPPPPPCQRMFQTAIKWSIIDLPEAELPSGLQ